MTSYLYCPQTFKAELFKAIAFKKNNPIENNANQLLLKKCFSKIIGIQSNKRIDEWLNFFYRG